MDAHFCSLGFKPATASDHQPLPGGGAYTLLRFPYGAQENDDPWDMHPRALAGRTFTHADPESGLIYPAVAGIGLVELDIILTAGDYRDVHAAFVRDPLGRNPDQTAYNHWARSAGENCFTATHLLKVRPGVPLGIQVAHDGASGSIRMAQFKLAIFQPALPGTERNRPLPGADKYGPDMA